MVQILQVAKIWLTGFIRKKFISAFTGVYFICKGEEMFSNRELKNLIVPLFLEQLLVLLVGIADIFVIGFAGEAATSGVSLVNSFNVIFLYLFTALATGGAVVISQYIGRQEKQRAGEAATQLFTTSILFSVVISICQFCSISSM